MPLKPEIMSEEEKRKLRNMVLTPWIDKATALIGVPRKVGGNQFRHVMGVFSILIDYKYFGNAILLKASIIHDLLEDVKNTDIDGLYAIDSDAEEVVKLVLEVTQTKSETKEEYLQRLLDHCSPNSFVLKAADRIQNLTDLHLDVFPPEKVANYLNQTVRYILPMVENLNPDMHLELTHLIEKRRNLLL